MSIYKVDGSLLNNAYNKSGISTNCYNIGGTLIFPDIGVLRVMTYNVGQWYLGDHDNVPANLDAEYYALQNGMIQSANADIVLLEEYTKQFSKTGRTAKSMLEQYYPYIHEEGGDNPQASTSVGRCICSKYPITNYVAHTYTRGAPFYFDSCVITINDVQYNVIVTHIYWTSNPADTTRDAEIAELVAFANNLTNVIIGGDFNNGLRPDLTEEGWTERYNRFVKPFIDADYNTANYGDFGDLITCYDSNDVAYCLDDIYTSANLLISNAYVDTTKLTDSIVAKVDHMPLIATVTI